MILKKINAICSWFLILAMLGHLGTMSYSMLTGWYDYDICKRLAFMTAGITVLHIAISLIIMFFMNEGSDFRYYRHLNRKTIIQRASGLIVIALLHLHVQAFSFIVTGEALSVGAKTGLLITEILFFGAIFTHLAVSFGKSVISFGLIRTETAEKITDRIMYTVCAFLFTLTSVALSVFVLNWTGWTV